MRKFTWISHAKCKFKKEWDKWTAPRQHPQKNVTNSPTNWLQVIHSKHCWNYLECNNDRPYWTSDQRWYWYDLKLSALAYSYLLLKILPHRQPWRSWQLDGSVKSVSLKGHKCQQQPTKGSTHTANQQLPQDSWQGKHQKTLLLKSITRLTYSTYNKKTSNIDFSQVHNIHGQNLFPLAWTCIRVRCRCPQVIFT